MANDILTARGIARFFFALVLMACFVGFIRQAVAEKDGTPLNAYDTLSLALEGKKK